MSNSLLIHLVGSLPLDDAKSVFETVGPQMGASMETIPDGETGRRQRWISFIADQLKAHPDLEVDPTEPKFPFKQWDGEIVYWVERRRFKPNVDPHAIKFDTGYARDALHNYEIFKQQKDAGIIPAHIRYQICMATPLAITYNFMSPKVYESFTEVYTRHLEAELEQITSALPHDQIAYQWDVCPEVLMWEGYFEQPSDYRAQILDSLGRLSRSVPEATTLGYHLCYGSPKDEHMIQPKDMSLLVELANGIAGAVKRPLQFIHMPVPHPRSDDAYFKPLTGLKLAAETALYLGLVHSGDAAGNAAKLTAARRYTTVSGIGAECGMGRGDPADLPTWLEAHTTLAQGS
jgi:hypothetical protein